MAETIPCHQLIPWSTRLDRDGHVQVSSALTRNQEVEIKSLVQNLDERLSEVQSKIHKCNNCRGNFQACIFLRG